jgi:hypothetical protein
MDEEQSGMLRTIVVTSAATAVFAIIALLSYIELDPLNTILNTLLIPASSGIARWTDTTFGVLLISVVLILMYAAALILVATMREWTRRVSGWFDIVVLIILCVFVSSLMFNLFVAAGVALGSIAFTLYLVLVQD